LRAPLALARLREVGATLIGLDVICVQRLFKRLFIGFSYEELMAFKDLKLGHFAMNTCLVVFSTTMTLLLIEVGLRLTLNPLLESRYVYWRRATFESFHSHYATSPPVEQHEADGFAAEAA
jgi:hypothetical protein